MWRFSAAAVSVLVLLVVAPAGTAGTHRKALARCAPRHAHVLAADAQAEVYEWEESNGYRSVVYGCAVGHRRSYYLGGLPEYSSSGGGGIEKETLAGPVAAYESASVGPAQGSTSSQTLVIVRDLRNGRRLHLAPAGTSPEIGPVVVLVVKDDGAVAWIAQDNSRSEGSNTGYEVNAVDRARSRLLAAGSDIDPHSLALKGSTLSWTQGGKPRSTSLH
jgi:hypothetical protein